jgi:hypothetical protein
VIPSAVVAALQRATRTVPIVFVGVIDPVGAGFVASLARPGGNATGFAASSYAIMRRAGPYRGENSGPGKDYRGPRRRGD